MAAGRKSRKPLRVRGLMRDSDIALVFQISHASKFRRRTENYLIQNGKARAGRTKRFWCMKPSVCVFGNLLGRFEILVIGVAVVILTVVRRVVATNLWTRFIDSATVVFLQVPANGVHQQVPSFIFNKNRCLFVKEVPSDIFEVSEVVRCTDRQRKVPTTLGGAVLAQIFTLREIFPFELNFR